MPEPINNAEEAVNNLNVNRTKLSADDIMQLLNSSLESGEPFASEFNRKVVQPLARKIDSKLYVSEIKVDGKEIGTHITDVLKQETLKPLQDVSKKVSKKLKDLTSDSDLFKVKDGGITFSDLFGGLEAGTEDLTAKRWNLLQRTIMTRIKRALPEQIKFGDDDTLTIDTLFGNVSGDSDVTNKKWSALQRDVIARVKKGLPDDAKFGGSILGASDERVDNTTNQSGPATGKFRSLVEKDDEVIIKSLGEKAMEQFADTFDFVTNFSMEQLKPPSWLAKLAEAGAILLAAGAAAAAYGLFTTGPFKGISKMVSKITLGAGLKLSKIVMKGTKLWVGRLLKMFGKHMPKVFKGFFNTIGKTFMKMIGTPVKALTKLVGKGFMKGMLKVFGRKMGVFLLRKGLKRIPIIGSILSIGFAISRFKKGDIVGGLIDLVSGLVGFLDLVAPGLGSILSLGVDGFQAFLDIKTGGDAGIESKNEAFFNFMKPVGDWVKEKLSHTALWALGESIQLMMAGDVKGGLKMFAKAVHRITPLGMLGTAIAWVTGKDPIEAGTADGLNKVYNWGKGLKDAMKAKLKKYMKNAPKWMKWVMSKIPGMRDAVESTEDLMGDTEGQWRSLNENEYVDPKWAKFREMERTGQLSTPEEYDEFARRHGGTERFHMNPMQNDFIWRSGGEIQPFNVNDNMVSIKDDKQFETLLGALSKKSDGTHDQYIADVASSVEQLAAAIAATPAPADNSPAPAAATGEIRDPAYVLRSRVWDRLRTGYSI